MATAVKTEAVTETKTVVVEPESFTLTLSGDEAQVILALLAHCRDLDSNFPEVGAIFDALRNAGAPDYYGHVDVVNAYYATAQKGESAHYELKVGSLGR